MALLTRMSSHRCLSTFVDLGAQMKQLNDRGQFRQTLSLFEKPDKKITTLVVNQALKACIELKDVKRGENIHKMTCGAVKKGEEIFRLSANKTIPMVNHLLKGLVDHHRSSEALALFQQTTLEKNEYTFALLYKICAHLADRNSFDSAFYMFIKSDDITMAEQVFIQIKDKNLITYSTMMNGFLSHSMAQRVLDLFPEIEQPTEIIWTLLFNACAQLKTETALKVGEAVFTQIPAAHRSSNDLLCSALNMFIKCNDREQAESLFHRIDRYVNAYSSMMEFYNAREEPEKTLKLFERMKVKKIAVNEIICLSVITAISSTSDLSLCPSVVSQIPPRFLTAPRIEVALIDMWGKVGSPDKGRDIFDRIKQPNNVSYKAMINAYALNGKDIAVVELFHQIPLTMLDSAIYPCVLNACLDSASIDEAKEIFDKIPIDQRNEEIYAIMIDAFRRACMLDQVAQIIKELKKSSTSLYPSNLSSSAQKNFKQGKSQSSGSANHLVSAKILLGNTYALSGDVSRAAQIRAEIARSGMKRVLGTSMTVVDGVIEKFTVNDRTHPRSAEIYAEIDRWAIPLAELGYRPNQAWISRQLRGNETVQSVLSAHSERLAIAFNLIQRPLPEYIQFVNNLRICGDCHAAIKLIAKFKQCLIIARDANRIHRFEPTGECSCRDYF